MRLLESWRANFADEARRLLGHPGTGLDAGSGLADVLHRHKEIRERGDAALAHEGRIPSWTMDEAAAARVFDGLDPDYRTALRRARDSILDFHERQRPNSWFTTGPAGEMYGQCVAPLGSAAFVFSKEWRFSPTSLMMYLAPAYVAGVEDLYVVFPARPGGQAPDPFAVALAWDWGAKAIFDLDPVSALLAFAEGTPTIPKVELVISNGGDEHKLAALAAGDRVACKVITDSNEAAILADIDADARVLAVDLFALSEDPDLTRLAVVTPSLVLANELEEEVERLSRTSPQGAQARRRLDELAVVVLTRSLEEALGLLRKHPPKHLSLFVSQPLDLLASVPHAGVVYLGRNTPAGIEHFFASASNLIPASGAVAHRGPLGVRDFMKTSSLVHYNPAKVREMHAVIADLARGEDLPFHEEAFRIRMAQDQ